MRLSAAPFLVLCLASCRPVSIAEAEAPPAAIQWTLATMPWRPGPPTLPHGARVAVLEGSPSAEGLFTMRLELPAGSRIAPHTHPRPERVTVISGRVAVRFGTDDSPGSANTFGAGDYYVNPPNVPHAVEFPESSVVQITGEGPWELRMLD